MAEIAADATAPLPQDDGHLEDGHLHECDLVMKGGITSGIVYPKAVLALKDRYRFRCIGGTSAGAIAAAATAAAEYGREARDVGGQDGFERLDALNARLCEPGFLRSLFQPSPRTRALMEVASAAMRPGGDSKPVRVLGKVARVVWALIRFTPRAVVVGAGAGAGVGVGLSALEGGTAGGWRRAAFLGLYGALGGTVGGLWALVHILFTDLPANGFGICIGHDPVPEGGTAVAQTGGGDGGDGGPVLIDWLIGQIEGIGGKKDGVPLTFGDLQSLRDRGGSPHPVFLKMMTTNLSEELPYALPFADNRFLFFAPDETALSEERWEAAVLQTSLRRYFPDPVIGHLLAKSPAPVPGLTLPPGFHFLPDGDDLPIVVAMRMSLSFPILLSAVPLWSVAASGWVKTKGNGRQPLTPADLSLNWFSDGGLSSNFPIQFFDSWLPTRPTFGIDLTPYPPGAFQPDSSDRLRPEKFVTTPERTDSGGRDDERRAADPSASVYLPRANEPPPKIVNTLPGLMSFLGAIVSTMQNYRDNQLAALPSYRERIVQVRLKKTEGGLNLDMPAATLNEIAAKGSAAGAALVSDFDFDEHQWTRFQVLMGQLEAELLEVAGRTGGSAPDFDVGRLLLKQKADGFPYRRKNPAWEADVRTALAAVQTLMRDWPRPPSRDSASGDAPSHAGSPQLFDRRRIKPNSNLRLMPQLYEPLPASPVPASQGPLAPDTPGAG